MALGYEFDDDGQDRRPRTPFGGMLARILANQIDPQVVEAALGGAAGGQTNGLDARHLASLTPEEIGAVAAAGLEGSGGAPGMVGAASGLGPEALAMLNQYANQIQPAAAPGGAAGAAGMAGSEGRDTLANAFGLSTGVDAMPGVDEAGVGVPGAITGVGAASNGAYGGAPSLDLGSGAGGQKPTGVSSGAIEDLPTEQQIPFIADALLRIEINAILRRRRNANADVTDIVKRVYRQYPYKLHRIIEFQDFNTLYQRLSIHQKFKWIAGEVVSGRMPRGNAVARIAQRFNGIIGAALQRKTRRRHL